MWDELNKTCGPSFIYAEQTQRSQLLTLYYSVFLQQVHQLWLSQKIEQGCTSLLRNTASYFFFFFFFFADRWLLFAGNVSNKKCHDRQRRWGSNTLQMHAAHPRLKIQTLICRQRWDHNATCYSCVSTVTYGSRIGIEPRNHHRIPQPTGSEPKTVVHVREVTRSVCVCVCAPRQCTMVVIRVTLSSSSLLCSSVFIAASSQRKR